jgi:NAD(P)-dependent dehydrogenase (short-subunit alcohol dehydrogenase family)
VTSECVVDLDLRSWSGESLITIERLSFRLLPPAAVARIADSAPRRQEVRWVPMTGAGAPVIGAGAPVAPSSATWVVASTDALVARDWQAQLSEKRIPSVTVTLASGARSQPPDLSLLADDADAERLLGDLQRQRRPVAGLIVHAAPDPDDADPDGVADRTYRLAESSFALLKHFLHRYGGSAAGLLICTTGAVSLPAQNRPPDLTQSVLNGLTRAVISEYPDLKCVQADLDPCVPPPLLPAVIDQAAGLPGSGHLALRDGRWYQARLIEADLPAASPRIRPDASYLITGGLGGLGASVADWLARYGARTLLLAGRHVSPEPSWVAGLRARGVRVELARADMSDPASVRALFDNSRRELPPLRGIIHAAGVTDDGSLEGLGWSRFREVLEPKVSGAWQLHRQTEGANLDFFVLFSSITSMVGAAGQAGYVAANSFLDTLAEYRRARGEAATSVGWGPWSGAGMAARPGVLPLLAARGLDAISADEALGALGHLLGEPAAHAGVARIDWRRAAGARQQPYTLLDDLRPPDPPAARPAPGRPVSELVLLTLTDLAQAREAVLTDLLARLGQLLGLTQADCDAVKPAFAGSRLSEFGLDSLTTIRLRNQLLADYAVDLAPELLFGGGTAADIADQVCQQLTLRNVIAADGALGDDMTEVITI